MVNSKAIRMLTEKVPISKNGILTLKASEFPKINGNQHRDLVLIDIKNRRLANRIKRFALQWYPSGYRVLFAAGGKGSRLVWMPLQSLDRLQGYAFGCRAYFPPARYRTLSELEQLMRKLRGKQGCPWDKQQNHRSLRPYLIEEAYEVVEAIERKDEVLLQEELGDLLLQVVFHAQISSEQGHFSLSDVLEGIITKIIRRHPHVFGHTRVSSVNDVLKTWEEIKKEEDKEEKGQPLLQDKDAHLPALLKALKTQQRASKLGFDWKDDRGVVDKLKEELQEFVDAYYWGPEETIEEELGDFLFSVVNFSRYVGANPEICLSRAVEKFNRRFAYVEEQVQASGRDFSCYKLEELDRWWEEAKKIVEKSNK